MVPGFFGDDEEYKRMQMAQALMGNQADTRTQNSGLANFGSSIGGALAMNAMKNKRDKAAYDAVPMKQTPISLPDGATANIQEARLPFQGVPTGGLFSGITKLFNLGAK